MPPPQGTWNPLEGPGDYTTTKTVHSDSYPAIDPTKANLSGKAVFVSGGSRGLGRSMALSYARAGASQIAVGARSNLSKVASDCKTAAKEAGKQEPEVLCLVMDITDQSSVERACRRIGEEFGKLDVVINNAGVIGDMVSIGDSTLDSWWQTYNVNVRGPYLVMRGCLPLLLKGELKTVATVASVGALVVMPTLSDYQSSKLAALRITEFFAKENAEQGIIAFSIHPGNILTDIVGMGEGMDDALKAVFTESPELAGDSLVYLTKERRPWISGRYLNVTWDLPELESRREEIVDGDLLKVRLALP
ncbi:uncharacterized protein LTR77_007888 [Saxophila tyrrhenica]|uniref:Uncharacterized protein n=1 Tax=Saxophila tyrrhenica TaxID=1690608 RepID=A0AAV9P7C4_9PEZI|nr:hypothetical protein LTR77_007888 [Saxophila tyrrhenica]